MAFDSREQLTMLVMQCVDNQFRSFKQDLETRIAVVLKQADVFPANVVIGMSRGVAQHIGDFISSELFRSGEIERAVSKQL